MSNGVSWDDESDRLSWYELLDEEYRWLFRGVFRVLIDTLSNPGYYGREDEDEILIEGRVEGVELSTGLEEEEENG